MLLIKLTKQGNSIAAVVPAAYRRELGWKLGDHVYLEIGADNTLLIRSINGKIKTRKRESAKGPGELTSVTKHIRLPKD